VEDSVPKRIYVIINPAAGKQQAVLHTINQVFRAARVKWDVSVTQAAGDALHYAREAVSSGFDLVAAYGGDGTIMEVAAGLIGSDVPLAILPGGTANVMAIELEVPRELELACELAAGGSGLIRQVDMGQSGDHYFLLRMGIGLEAEMVEGADRDLKDRLGYLAYGLSALQALRQPSVARYHLSLDGSHVESEGITCIITNAGSLGQPGLSLSPRIDVSDGLLDVLVLRQADLGSLLSVAASVLDGIGEAEPVQHWQARELTVDTDPPQSVQGDGEPWGKTPVSITVVPRAVGIVTPPEGQLANRRTEHG
jgi:diacylglycerol kinase (ATP)